MALDDTESRRKARRGNRSVLVGLFALFVAPILFAYALNLWWPHWSPFGRMNHGEIVEPAWEVELAAVGRYAGDRTTGRWILLQPAVSSCGDACETLLQLTRRVHLSLGKDYDRVVRMFVHRADLPVDQLRSIDADLILIPAPVDWFDRIAEDGMVLLLVDPKRQAVLQYRAGLQGKGLARDLARLLKISKIG